MNTEVSVLIAAMISTIVAGVTGIVAQAAPAGAADGVAAWLYGGGSIAAVGCLAYIARQFANGSVVARNTAEMQELVDQREALLAKLVEQAHRRETDFLDFLRKDHLDK